MILTKNQETTDITPIHSRLEITENKLTLYIINGEYNWGQTTDKGRQRTDTIPYTQDRRLLIADADRPRTSLMEGMLWGRDWFNPEGLHDPPPPGLLPECALTLVSQPENEVSVTHFIFHSSVTLIKSHVACADGELTDPR